MKALRFSLLLILAVAGACSAPSEQAATEKQPEEALAPPVYESALPADLRPLVDRPFTGDLDAMIQRRLIRAGVPFNRTLLLHRQRRSARTLLRISDAVRGGS